jgi:hypothetical protein
MNIIKNTRHNKEELLKNILINQIKNTLSFRMKHPILPYFCAKICVSVCLFVGVSPYHQLDWMSILQMRYFQFEKKIDLGCSALIGIGIRIRLKLLRIATMGKGALFM